MVKFLHISDIHLGTNQYKSPEETRKKDYFFAFKDVIERYAIDENVDFVIIGGDLFDKNRIDPRTLNQAIYVFKLLEKNNIPVYMIEGNHDMMWGDETVSWIHFLHEHRHVHLLNADFDDENPFNVVTVNDQVRIVGVKWLGSRTASAIPKLQEELAKLPKHPYTIMMLHAGIEGYLAGYGTLTKQDLEPLKPYVNYLALGHIHKHYIYDGWAFNPGCLEPCAFNEYFDEHGALLVNIDQDNHTRVKLVKNYKKREFIRVKADISQCKNTEEAWSYLVNIIKKHPKRDNKPMLEIVIDGMIGFRRTDLNITALKELAQEELKALVVLLKYFARPKEYAVGAELTMKNSREQIELTVFKDLLSQQDDYKNNAEEYSKAMISLKQMVLTQESGAQIYEYLTTLLNKEEN